MRRDRENNIEMHKTQILMTLFDLQPKTKQEIFHSLFPDVPEWKVYNKEIAWYSATRAAFGDLAAKGLIKRIRRKDLAKYNKKPKNGRERDFWIFDHKRYFSYFFMSNFGKLGRSAAFSKKLFSRKKISMEFIKLESNPLSYVIGENALNYALLMQVLYLSEIRQKINLRAVGEEIDRLIMERIDAWYRYEKRRKIVYSAERLKIIRKACISFMQHVKSKRLFSKSFINKLDAYYGELLIPPRHYFSRKNRFGSPKRIRTILHFTDFIAHPETVDINPADMFIISCRSDIRKIL